MDDVNILAYGNSMEENCRTLTRVHTGCTRWARRHGAVFAPAKYELIHLAKQSKKFNMQMAVTIEDQEIRAKTDIRVLGVQIDTRLKWGPHIWKIEG